VVRSRAEAKLALGIVKMSPTATLRTEKKKILLVWVKFLPSRSHNPEVSESVPAVGGHKIGLAAEVVFIGLISEITLLVAKANRGSGGYNRSR